MKKEHVNLAQKDREKLLSLVDQGGLSGRKYKRALALLELNRGKSYAEVSQTVNLHPNTLSTLVNRYEAEGLQCLDDRPRSGRPPGIAGGTLAKITALACSKPPTGHQRWSLRLLAERIVQLE